MRAPPTEVLPCGCPNSRAPTCRRLAVSTRSADRPPTSSRIGAMLAAVLPCDETVLFELDDGVLHRVADPRVHRHSELRAERQTLRTFRSTTHSARAIDFLMTIGIGSRSKIRSGGAAISRSRSPRRVVVMRSQPRQDFSIPTDRNLDGRLGSHVTHEACGFRSTISPTDIRGNDAIEVPATSGAESHVSRRDPAS